MGPVWDHTAFLPSCSYVGIESIIWLLCVSVYKQNFNRISLCPFVLDSMVGHSCSSCAGYTSQKNRGMKCLSAEWTHSLDWVPQDTVHCHSIATHDFPATMSLPANPADSHCSGTSYTSQNKQRPPCCTKGQTGCLKSSPQPHQGLPTRHRP